MVTVALRCTTRGAFPFLLSPFRALSLGRVSLSLSLPLSFFLSWFIGFNPLLRAHFLPPRLLLRLSSSPLRCSYVDHAACVAICLQWTAHDTSHAFAAADAHGDNALHTAASQNSMRAIALLTKPELGFDLTARNGAGLTAHEVAEQAGHVEATAFLADPVAAQSVAAAAAAAAVAAADSASASASASASTMTSSDAAWGGEGGGGENFATFEGGHSWVRLYDEKHECEYWHCEGTGESRWVNEPVAETEAEVAADSAAAALTATATAAAAAEAEVELPTGWTKVESRSKPGKFFFHRESDGKNVWSMKKVMKAERKAKAAKAAASS